MDATGRRLVLLRDQKGIALVYVAILLVAFCAFLGLAIDLGYMYLVRGELQNAADAAALAGASQLVEGGGVQLAARTEAVAFAEKNVAASIKVRIASDGSDTLSESNDVTVGNWNSNRTPKFIPGGGGHPLNAVQVRARRTDASDPGGTSPDGSVDLFFARMVNNRWTRMGAAAISIAQRAPRAGFYIMLGRLVCNSTGTVSLSPAAGNMAWTSLLDNSTGAKEVRERFICPTDQLQDVEVCGQSVYTTNGTSSDIFKAVEVDFNDPDYDRGNKTFVGGDVTSWTLIVPVSTMADPSIQPSPQPVWGYARIVITRACGSGGGNPCPGRDFFAKSGCSGGEDDIVISSITCVPCESSSELYGARPSLVQ